MSENRKFDILAGKRYQALRRPDPVIKVSDIKGVFSTENHWEWADEKYSRPVVSREPALVGGVELGSGYYYTFSSSTAGPCGMARSELGLSPCQVGIYPICRSDIQNCSRCPMNPNRSENEK